MKRFCWAVLPVFAFVVMCDRSCDLYAAGKAHLRSPWIVYRNCLIWAPRLKLVGRSSLVGGGNPSPTRSRSTRQPDKQLRTLSCWQLLDRRAIADLCD